VVSTASPAKFPEVVEPLIGSRVPVPETLARLFDRPSVFEEIDASLESLRTELK
jgi:threonine synthase